MRADRVVVVCSMILCCAGLAMGQTEWVKYPDNPLIEPGAPGEWDDCGHYVTGVVFDGTSFHMWLSGRNCDTGWDGVGHATSSDGVAWTMDPNNPVITAGEAGEWDGGGVGAGAVVYDGTHFHMWYGGDESDGNRSQTGYATSEDGSVWTKYTGNPVMEVGPPGSWYDTWIFSGTVLVEGETYRMWLLGSDDTEVRIGYAESDDGINWVMRPDPLLEPGLYPGAWDMWNHWNPYVVFDGSTYRMWFGSDQFWDSPLRIGYAFSIDGIEWVQHRGNPVLEGDVEGWGAWGGVLLYDEPVWHMWYTSNQPDGPVISYATSDCCAGEVGLNYSLFIPAAAVTAGSEGAFFQTDVDLSNADDQPAQYEIMWLPQGESNAEPTTSETFTLGAGMSVRYANVLTEVFGLEPNSVGALCLVSSSPDLLAMSRTYNSPTAETEGTYGQAIPAIAPDGLIQAGERKRILFASENADLRTNVGCLNTTEETARISIELFSADGTSHETMNMLLRPWSNDQFNRIFDDYKPVEGYVEVWTPMDARIYCYGSVLDNVTSDPTTIPPQ